MPNPVMSVRRERRYGDDALLGRNCWTWCPGCEVAHVFSVNLEDGTHPGEGPVWEWDGNTDAPTFSPSMLVRQGDDQVCHSFVKAGVWQFLSDSTHQLAGQNVPMVPLPDWLVPEAGRG